MSSAKQNFRAIYDLLDNLCRKFSSDRHKEILKTVTANIADNQGFLSNLNVDESLIVARIKNHLSSSSADTNLSVFLNLHEDLVTFSDPKFRSSILTLLLLLSDTDPKLPNTNNNNNNKMNSVFTLPSRNRLAESSSMEQIYRGISSRVSAGKEVINDLIFK